jgi:ketosteroid isomerase-like protein
MGIEENKNFVLDVLASESAGRGQAVLDAIADDGIWWGLGAGSLTKKEFAKVFESMWKVLKEPIRLTIKGVTAEGERVAVEAEGDTQLVNGNRYHNFYHFLFIVRDGKIKEFKEYHDTKYAAEAFGELLPTDQMKS